MYLYIGNCNVILAFWAFSIAIGGLWLYRWRERAKRFQCELAHCQEQLQELTQLLQVKNARLRRMEAAAMQSNDISLSFPGNQKEKVPNIGDLHNLRILTEEDWMAFKKRFELSCPGYLSRLRTTFSNITNAEERLFLLLKLGLNRREVVKILGVSKSTVKKGRSRLRKRLELDKEQDLEQFIQSF